MFTILFIYARAESYTSFLILLLYLTLLDAKSRRALPFHFISDIFGKMSDDTSPPDITKLYDQEEENIIKEISAVVIDYNKNDSEEIFTLDVPVVSIRNEIENIGVAMEEDVEQDDAPPDKGGFGYFVDCRFGQNIACRL